MTIRASRLARFAAVAASVAISLTALPSLSANAAPAPATVTTARAASAPASKLKVATYNVMCATCGSPSWEKRRGAVVSNIKSRDLDVVGIQEASQGWLKSGGHSIDLSQFEDLRNRLGSDWALANTARNNCVKAKTPTRCVYKDQGASKGDKIVYRADRLDKLADGSKLLPGVAGKNDRYMVWAQLRQKSSGKQFMFASMHLAPGDDVAGATTMYDLKIEEMRVAVAEVKEHNPDGLPVVLVGDFNSSRFEKISNGPYDVLTHAGYVDPLGGAYRTTRSAPGATVEHRVNTWLNSFNDFVKTPKGNKSWLNGSHIDYIFTSGLRVSEFEVVAKLNSSKTKFSGRIPSDHNMLRADVWI